MTIIIGKALMNRLLCALIGFIFMVIFRNEKRIKRSIRNYKNMDFLLTTFFVVIPFVIPSLGWTMHVILLLVVLYNVMKK